MFMRLLFLNKLAGFKVLGIWQHRKRMIYLWITFIYLFLIPDFQVLDVPLVNWASSKYLIINENIQQILQ